MLVCSCFILITLITTPHYEVVGSLYNNDFQDSNIVVKRWVDVDEDDANANDGNRQKTPSEPDSFSNLIGNFDQGLQNSLKSVNDITNLESAAQAAPQPEPAPEVSMTGATRGSFETAATAGVPFLGNGNVNSQNGGSIDYSNLPGAGDVNPIVINTAPVARPDLPPGTVITNGAPDQQTIVTNGAAGYGGPSGYPGPECANPPCSFNDLHITAGRGPLQASDGEPKIMLPQANIINPLGAEHREEGPAIIKTEPSVHKYVPGRTVFMKPIRIIHKPRIRHVHMYHRPRIIVIRRRRPHHLSKFIRGWSFLTQQ